MFAFALETNNSNCSLEKWTVTAVCFLIEDAALAYAMHISQNHGNDDQLKGMAIH